MKHLIIFSYLLLPLTCLGQDSKWGFGVDISIGGIQLSNTKDRMIETDKSWTWAGNYWAHYRLSDRILISSGAGLSTYHVTISDYSVTLPCDHDGAGGVDFSNSYIRLADNLRFLSIPLQTSIFLGKNKGPFYLNPGINVLFSFFDNAHVELHQCGVPGGTSNNFYRVNDTRLQSEFNVGYEVDYSERFSKYLQSLALRFEVGAQYEFTSFLDSRLNQSKLWSFGGSLGVRVALK